MTAPVFFIVFKPSGQIVRAGSAVTTLSDEVQADSDEMVAETPVLVDDRLAYVVGSEIVPRPTLDFAALPAGTRITAYDASLDITFTTTTETETSLEDAIDIPGEWEVTLRPPFPHQPFRGTVDVG